MTTACSQRCLPHQPLHGRGAEPPELLGKWHPPEGIPTHRELRADETAHSPRGSGSAAWRAG
eukprot:80403-Prymnesium_polylepis.3